MKRIAVFCGSSLGSKNEYKIAAQSLGKTLVRNGIGLVFGGGAVGLMGEIARQVLALGGEAIGVIPKVMVEKELALEELSDLRIVGSMHERKALIAELSNGFIALPGGLGTIEEIFEALTWTQLGFQTKPCGFLNTLNYFGHLIQFIDHMTNENFINEKHRDIIFIESNPELMLERLKQYEHHDVDKSAWALNQIKFNREDV